MTRILLLLTAGLFAVDLVHPAPQRTRPEPVVVQDWAGIYRLHGILSDGKSYVGTATIAPSTSGLYAFDTLSGGGHCTGIAQTHEGALVAAWAQDGKIVGLSVLRKKDGAITNHWISRPGTGTVNRETLVYLGKVRDE